MNTVVPGPTETDMNAAHGPFANFANGFLAVGRYAQAEEIAGMVAYLASAEAGFVTGARLLIDGRYVA